jgi:hypothetical protein
MQTGVESAGTDIVGASLAYRALMRVALPQYHEKRALEDSQILCGRIVEQVKCAVLI